MEEAEEEARAMQLIFSLTDFISIQSTGGLWLAFFFSAIRANTTHKIK